MNKLTAFIIGVGTYEDNDVTDLPVTLNDASSFANILSRKSYNSKTIILKTGKNACKDDIKNQFKKITIEDFCDLFIFYFSGHGIRVKNKGKWETFLCPWDCDANRIIETCLSETEIRRMFSKIAANNFVAIFDSCHAGAFTLTSSKELKGTDFKNGISKTFLDSISTTTGKVSISSSSQDEKSYTRKEEDFSIFTWYMLKGLEGEADFAKEKKIRIFNLFQYISKGIAENNIPQVPTLSAYDIKNNFVISQNDKSYNKNGQKEKYKNIKQVIIESPTKGAKTFSKYLEKQGKSEIQNTVDVLLAELIETEKNISLYGYSRDFLANKNRIIHSLLNIYNQNA